MYVGTPIYHPPSSLNNADRHIDHVTIDDNLIREAIAELQLLAVKKPLEGANLSRAKELMKTLRTAGYTNQDVSDLTSGAWTEPRT